MSLVYVFASSKMEAQPVLALARKNTPMAKGKPVMVEAGGNRFELTLTRMGVGNARLKADAALRPLTSGADGGLSAAQKPDAILVIGLCGGLTEDMREDRIVAYTECLSTNKSMPLKPSPALTSSMIDLLQQHRISCGRVTGITSPRIASNRSEKQALARSGASVVDMETYQILSAAARAVIPCAVLRIVGDPLGTNIPDFNSALDANGGLIGSKAIWIALGSPFETWHLLAVNKRAVARLAPAVKLILESNCFSNLKAPARN